MEIIQITTKRQAVQVQGPVKRIKKEEDPKIVKILKTGKDQAADQQVGEEVNQTPKPEQIQEPDHSVLINKFMSLYFQRISETFTQSLRRRLRSQS
ncbi:unnamed protein product, partial [Nesidiocoris tenuis]